VSRVLDWLIAHQVIEPIVAVFVGQRSRGNDHLAGAPLRTFLNDELMTWLASHYAVTGSEGKRAIIGISFGAKDALDAALSCGGAPDAPFDDPHGDLSASVRSAGTPGCQRDPFGRLGLLIPGRRLSRADIDAIAGRHRHRLRASILAGRYDHANVETARSLRRALADAGHVVDYTEVPEGHSAVTWTNHLGGLIVSLFGAGQTRTSPGSVRP
jgi:enterochelin esterase-like enzyme